MDELEAQLKRYADAAAERVAATPERPPHRRKWRPLLAVAAAVALIGASLGVFLVARGTDGRIDTVPAEPTPTSVTVPDTCPTSGEEPRPDQLHLALPWPARVDEIQDPKLRRGAHHLLIRPGDDDSIEVEIHDVGPVLTVSLDPDAQSVEALVCDPHHGSSPASVAGTFSRTPAANRQLTVVLDRWVLVLTAKPEGTSSVTLHDLKAVVAGMSWPAPVADEATTTPETSDRCAEPDTAIEVGSLTVTAVPDDYEPMLPVEVEDGGVPVDLGGESRASLTLLHPTDGGIQVTSFATGNPAQYLSEQTAIGNVEHVNVRVCTWTGERFERSDQLVTIARNGGLTAAMSHTSEYEGFLVLGPYTQRDRLLEVVGGLRF